jgi:hypothetical protein
MKWEVHYHKNDMEVLRCYLVAKTTLPLNDRKKIVRSFCECQPWFFSHLICWTSKDGAKGASIDPTQQGSAVIACSAKLPISCFKK